MPLYCYPFSLKNTNYPQTNFFNDHQHPTTSQVHKKYCILQQHTEWERDKRITRPANHFIFVSHSLFLYRSNVLPRNFLRRDDYVANFWYIHHQIRKEKRIRHPDQYFTESKHEFAKISPLIDSLPSPPVLTNNIPLIIKV